MTPPPLAAPAAQQAPRSPAAAAPPEAPAPPTGLARPPGLRGGLVVLAGILLVALNLRIAVTSLGALLDEVRVGLGLTAGMAGLVTALPTLAFAAVGALTPWLTRRVSAGRILVTAMAALAVGQVLRAVTGSPAVFVATSALALSGIAVANVLLPVLVKHHFPDRPGAVTGAYSVALVAGSTVGAAAAVPVAQAAGSWRAGLGVWAVLAVVAALPLLLKRRRSLRSRGPGADQPPSSLVAPVAALPALLSPDDGAPGQRRRSLRSRGPGADQPPSSLVAPVAALPALLSPDDGAPGGHARVRPGRTRLGWAMAAYFGTQSLAAYATMGWLAQLFRDSGHSPRAAGALLGAAMAVGLPVALIMPALAGRWRARLRPLVLGLSASAALAYAGLAFAPRTGTLLWVVLLAVGQGAFPLALAAIGMRARTFAGTVALSAFTQSAGYLVAALGPLVVGVLYEATGGWRVPIGFLAVALAVQTVAGLGVARPGYIEDAAGRPAG